MKSSDPSERFEVVTFRPELAPDFARLNQQWIEQYFEIEEADRIVFSDPFNNIVEPGGQIFFVVSGGQVYGTCAMMRTEHSVFELAKMAVAPQARGRGYGDVLMRAAIEFAKQEGASKVFLLSNTRLGPAIALYRKHGFKEVKITDAHDYQRVDIQMELIL